ncbi:Eukaryotic translation initiation factor 2-alpha kinase 3 [Phytophthora citrophthora]|uniref:non-specific serine/threonine protein kinase n=1 Tax=Phytophthora citrophthora TaxID=4793 RepID=A0AAD9G8V9_9STRA|nr:Eukaryotic translation initiation factor 2-alpha kinase 3 [Phytophthora citrophthora]
MTSPPPSSQRRERPGERSGSGLFERSNPFETDFGDKELIAQGGFGKVFKCKSNTDGHWYAVKLEQFWFKPETYFNPSEVRDVMMNEALALARLDHENVCRYYNTWVLGSLIPAVNKGQKVEQPEGPCYSPTYSLTRRTSSPAGSSPARRTSFASASDSVDEDDDADMCSSSYSDAYSYDPEDDHVASFNDLGFDMEASDQDELKVSPRMSLARTQRLAAGKRSPQRINEEGDESFNRPRPKPLESPGSGAFITQIDVYIQMALYEGKSLREWMDQRKSGEIDTDKNMHIFHQIVNGLRYVHKQGLVHRDIKPANVFLTREFCVKIGDFGLSKNTLQTSLNLHPSRYLCEEGDDSFDTMSYNSTDDEMEEVSELSVGVGTPLYSSPEQTQGHQTCAAPSDVYSLGVLLCELFCTFTTQMERYVVLNNVRKGQLPPVLLEENPQIAELISAMVQQDPQLRPTCADILECGIFEHQKLHFNYRIPDGPAGVSPLARALLSRSNCSSTVLNLLRSIMRLEQEQEAFVLQLEPADRRKVKAFFPDATDGLRPAETLLEVPVSPVLVTPTAKILPNGALTAKTIHELKRLSNERRRLLDSALHELQL